MAPAMHTGMWEHPATRGNVADAARAGRPVCGPASGALAHGDEGIGRMVEPDDIVAAASSTVARVPSGEAPDDLTGRAVVVTAGPTYEAIDPVRFLGNRSSGRMGVAVAVEAARRGARVHLVLGPGTVAPPPGVETEHVTSAEQMRAAVHAHVDAADAIVMAAAVADFRPKRVSPGKLKKGDGPARSHPRTDSRHPPRARGSAPTRIGAGRVRGGDERRRGGRSGQAQSQGVDLLVANEVGRPGTGFGSDTNHAAILDATGDDVALRDWTKAELATAIVDRIVARLD